MSKYLVVLFFFLSVFSKSYSQSSMSDYSFVIVPERFDFLDEVDKYQLNSISEFLFNKYGFHAFKSNNVPNAKRCDGLYADVVNVNAFLKTKLQLILRDCNGFEVYRSPEGVTKLKKFKQAHQDALRKAFEYFEGMGVKQKEIVYFDDNAVVESTNSKETGVATTQELSQGETVIAAGAMSLNLPKARFSTYKKGDETFMLRKTEEGYFLLKETSSAEDGLLFVGKIEITDAENTLNFIDTQDAVFKASFDAAENLVIKKNDTELIYNRVR